MNTNTDRGRKRTDQELLNALHARIEKVHLRIGTKGDKRVAKLRACAARVRNIAEELGEEQRMNSTRLIGAAETLDAVSQVLARKFATSRRDPGLFPEDTGASDGQAPHNDGEEPESEE